MKRIQKKAEGDISRRGFLGCGAGVAIAAAVPSRSAAASPNDPLTKVWARYVTGGHPYRPAYAEMFLDPLFVEIEVGPSDLPNNLALVGGGRGGTGGGGGAAGRGGAASGGRGGNGPPIFAMDNPPDLPWIPSSTIQSGVRSLMPGAGPSFAVLILNDQTDWPTETRPNVEADVNAGKGFVVMHNALGDNQNWPWWYREVTGGLLVLSDHDGMKKSTITPSATVDVRPVGNHPVLEGVEPMRLVKEETYRGMWQSPNTTPLLQTTGSGSDKVVAWVGPNQKSRVVCIAPGFASETFRTQSFRKLVRNAILWTSGRWG
jgi:hypothetical protein